MKYLAFLLFLFLHLFAIGQKKTKEFSANQWLTKTLFVLPAKSSNPVSLNQISHIQISDKRFETSSWGLVKKDKAVYKIVAPDSTKIEQSLQEYINRKFKCNVTASNSVLAVVRHFYFSNERKKNDFENYSKLPVWSPGIAIKIDFYLQKEDGYHPWFRFHEDYISTEKKPVDHIDEIISEAIDFAFQKLTEADKAVISSNSKLVSPEEIEAVNQQALQLPILLTDSLKKGVYKSFKEFTNNSPSIPDYRIEKNERSSKLIVEKDGQEFPVKNIWGFCDGERIFIQCNNNFFQLARIENSFFSMAAKSYSDKLQINPVKLATEMALIVVFPTGAYLAPNSLEVNKYYQRLNPYLLNMETGELY